MIQNSEFGFEIECLVTPGWTCWIGKMCMYPCCKHIYHQIVICLIMKIVCVPGPDCSAFKENTTDRYFDLFSQPQKTMHFFSYAIVLVPIYNLFVSSLWVFCFYTNWTIIKILNCCSHNTCAHVLTCTHVLVCIELQCFHYNFKIGILFCTIFVKFACIVHVVVPTEIFLNVPSTMNPEIHFKAIQLLPRARRNSIQLWCIKRIGPLHATPHQWF